MISLTYMSWKILLKEIKLRSNVEVSQKLDFTCSYLYKLSNGYNTLGSYRYRFEATVINPNKYDKAGKVITFENLKHLMSQVVFDQCFLYNKYDDEIKFLVDSFDSLSIPTISFDGPVSAEIILERISLRLVEVVNRYGLGAIVKCTNLRENANSCVTWTRKD